MNQTINLVIFLSLLCSCNHADEVPQWGIFENEIISEKNYTDPYRDVDLMVTVSRPDGSSFELYGFYDGGNSWKFRIMPDMEGAWRFSAAFSDNSATTSGQFSCIKSNLTGPLEPYSQNPIWPSYRGSTPVQMRSFHTGDRFFASNFSDEHRNRFLGWMQKNGYNMLSVGSHYLNRQQPGRGKDWNTPRLWPLAPEEYRRMENILSGLEKRNIYVHPFAGFFGRAAEWPVDHNEQELYIRYTLARISAFRNVILNIGGPEPLLKPEEYQNGNMTREDINRVAFLIRKYDPYSHMLSIHNRTGNGEGDYERDPFIHEKWEDYSTLQGAKSTDLNDTYNFIIDSRKVVKPVYAHEVMWFGNMYHEGLDTETLRKKAVTLLMAGSFINFGDMNGNSSSGFSGSLDPDSAHTEAHSVLRTVWNIFDSIPYYSLKPRPDLVKGAYCLSDGSSRHLIYAPENDPFTLNFEMASSAVWIDPADESRTKAIVNGSLIIPPGKGNLLLWIEN